MEESQRFCGSTLGGFHPGDHVYLFLTVSPTLSAAGNPRQFVIRSVLEVRTLSAMHLDMVTSISHGRLFSVAQV